MREISRFVLGPYWRSASEDQRRRFLRLLEDDIIGFYRRQFTRYTGESFRVTAAREVPGGTIVTSQILPPDGAPIEVDWRLGEHDGFYKISDVVIDGVSMVLSERYTLAQQIQANGGHVAGLLRQIQQQGLTGSSSPR
jgi:phospholipid transport system substrate-binding protein